MTSSSSLQPPALTTTPSAFLTFAATNASKAEGRDEVLVAETDGRGNHHDQTLVMGALRAERAEVEEVLGRRMVKRGLLKVE